jgi:quercetin dioxygenase-like cupin family protein
MERATSDKRPRAGLAIAGSSLALALALAAPLHAAPKPPPTEERQAAEAIERAMQRHGPEVHRCFEQVLADRLDVSGKVEVEVEVGGGGKVKQAKLLSKNASPALAACVQARAAAWTLEGIEAGAAVVLPFSFQGQMNQFVVKAADAPDRGPVAPKVRAGAPQPPPPFSVKVLADPVNVRAQHVSLTLLSVSPANRVAMHRHPRNAKILYLISGHARLLGPAGAAALKLDPGAAVFLPAGYPHAIENMGRQNTAVFLQAFAPPGPERVYRNPADAAARADFEVIRDAAKAVPPPNSKVTVAELDKATRLKVQNGKASARILLDEKLTGSAALSLSVVEFQPGAEVPRHTHPGASEVLYVLTGGGELTVGSESMPYGAETALHIPADQPHGGKFTREGPTLAVQIYAPAGAEQRYRGPAPAGGAVPAKAQKP